MALSTMSLASPEAVSWQTKTGVCHGGHWALVRRCAPQRPRSKVRRHEGSACATSRQDANDVARPWPARCAKPAPDMDRGADVGFGSGVAARVRLPIRELPGISGIVLLHGVQALTLGFEGSHPEACLLHAAGLGSHRRAPAPGQAPAPAVEDPLPATSSDSAATVARSHVTRPVVSFNEVVRARRIGADPASDASLTLRRTLSATQPEPLASDRWSVGDPARAASRTFTAPRQPVRRGGGPETDAPAASDGEAHRGAGQAARPGDPPRMPSR